MTELLFSQRGSAVSISASVMVISIAGRQAETSCKSSSSERESSRKKREWASGFFSRTRASMSGRNTALAKPCGVAYVSVR